MLLHDWCCLFTWICATTGQLSLAQITFCVFFVITDCEKLPNYTLHLEKAAKTDENVTKNWNRESAWFLAGIGETDSEPDSLEIGRYRFWYHGIGRTLVALFLSTFSRCRQSKIGGEYQSECFLPWFKLPIHIPAHSYLTLHKIPPKLKMVSK